MRPLDGIRVLDFSHALAGPLCTYHLALLGADVIKIERPGVGDDLRHYTGHSGPENLAAPFVAANAGKRSIALDLKTELGREAVRRLTAMADVVVENFRPGVPKKLGIDWESLSKLKPQLVYCSLTGFGATGQLRDWTAYDHIVQAMSGIMWLNGEPDQGPLKVGLPFADTFSGYVAAFAIMTSLFQRERQGRGQLIDLGMLDATLVLLAQGIATYQMSGRPPIRTGNRGYRLTATADTYLTNDGFLSIGANQQHQFEALCRALGCEHLLRDPRFADFASRSQHNEELRLAFAELFVERSAAELEELLAASQVPAAKVRNIQEVLQHPHVKARDLFVDVKVPGVEPNLKLAGLGFRLDADTPVSPLVVPTIGQHTDQILREIGLI
jgi:CoA:oxalate CoA-transferase